MYFSVTLYNFFSSQVTMLPSLARKMLTVSNMTVWSFVPEAH